MSKFNPKMYNAKFYRGRRTRHPALREAMEVLNNLWGPFESVLDLGAGDGICAAVLAETGAEPHMVEINEIARRYACRRDVMQIRIHDLREPLDYGRMFDVVLCMEVAEHLPKSAADTLCDTVVRHVGRLLVFTAAPLGQVGGGHINLQPQRYWRQKFKERGLTFQRGMTKKLKSAWLRGLGGKLKHTQANVQVWTR